MLRSLLFGSNGTRLHLQLRLIDRLRRRGWPQLACYLAFRLQRRFGCYISHEAEIGRGVSFPHPTGIVIGEGVKIGPRCKIFQNVTLGGARIGDQQASNYPEVGAGTVIFAGAVIVGAVRIGQGCIIGANAVVLGDVPDYSVAVGAPARIVKTIFPEQSFPSAPSPETLS